jgi:hypothetical protein
MKKSVVLPLVVVFLAGCKSAAESSAELRSKVIANGKSDCEAIGHKPGSKEFASCVERYFYVAAEASARRDAVSQAAGAAIAQSMMQDAAQRQQAAEAALLSAGRPNLTCSTGGNTTTCR